jgi:hypothetical protein
MSSNTCSNLQDAIAVFNRTYVAYIKDKTNIDNKQSMIEAHSYLANTINCLNSNVTNKTVYSDKDIGKYDDIKEKYPQLLSLRQDLDLKLQELYRVKNTIPVENKQQLDSVVYMSILWTVLATSAIYFVIAKM